MVVADTMLLVDLPSQKAFVSASCLFITFAVNLAGEVGEYLAPPRSGLAQRAATSHEMSHLCFPEGRIVSSGFASGLQTSLDRLVLFQPWNNLLDIPRAASKTWHLITIPSRVTSWCNLPGDERGIVRHATSDKTISPLLYRFISTRAV